MKRILAAWGIASATLGGIAWFPPPAHADPFPPNFCVPNGAMTAQICQQGWDGMTPQAKQHWLDNPAMPPFGGQQTVPAGPVPGQCACAPPMALQLCETAVKLGGTANYPC